MPSRHRTVRLVKGDVRGYWRCTSSRGSDRHQRRVPGPCELDPATLLLVRIAALAAVDAPAASYLMHVGPAVESGVQVEQVQDVLVAVAPIIGAPRVLSAATKITEALGIAIAVAEMAAEATRASTE